MLSFHCHTVPDVLPESRDSLIRERLENYLAVTFTILTCKHHPEHRSVININVENGQISCSPVKFCCKHFQENVMREIRNHVSNRRN